MTKVMLNPMIMSQKVHLPEPLRQHAAAHFGEPVMERAENGEDDQPDDHEVKMRDEDNSCSWSANRAPASRD